MKSLPEAAGRRLKRLVGREKAHGGGTSLNDLQARVTELEDEIQEARRLNLRVAELLDIVEELLVPLAQRDEAKVQAYLDSHVSPL
jgi:hypothetical protein